MPALVPGQTPTAQPGLVTGIPPAQMSQNGKEPSRVRSFFPETWLWMNSTSGYMIRV